MSTNNRQFRKYLRWWLTTLVLLLVAFAAINYFVDPYGLFDSPRINGFNRLKPSATTRDRVVKPYMVNTVAPATIIAGNSRPKMGVNPDNSCWLSSEQPVYNLGVPGASVYMVARYAQHAMAAGNVKQIFWGLDFIDFLNYRKRQTTDLDWPPDAKAFEVRLRVDAQGKANNGYLLQRIKDHMTLLFSLDALKDSVVTILSQKNMNAPTVRRNGFDPAKKYIDIMRLEGQGLMFKQKDLSLMEIFNRPENRLFDNDRQQSPQFEVVQQFLKIAKQNNVELVLFINPYHSDYLTIVQQAGLWPMFQSWKRQLVIIADRFDVPLWDFSGYNDLSNIQPPAPGDTHTILKWFWEPAHYREQYGNQMLGKMLGRRCDKEDDVIAGVKLTPENIEQHIERENAAMLRYQSDFPDATKRIRKLNTGQ